MRGGGVFSLLVVQLINVVRKTKKIKTKSKKIRNKKYKISSLYSNCRMIDSATVGCPEIMPAERINIPITITYSNYERI